jgi:hypothetical protein
MAYIMGRPPKDAVNVERLSPNGRWYPDNGKPGIAFSGQDSRGFPLAWYGDTCAAVGCTGKCPACCASQRTCNRFGCSNGTTFKRAASERQEGEE